MALLSMITSRTAEDHTASNSASDGAIARGNVELRFETFRASVRPGSNAKPPGVCRHGVCSAVLGGLAFCAPLRGLLSSC
jgi:hypothetical protein